MNPTAAPIGSPADMQGRLRAALPRHWFADTAPVLDSLLAGLAVTWSWLHGQVAYLRRQTRIATLTDAFLDMASGDYLGARLPRRRAEADAAFRLRIQRELLRERGTRPALVAVLTDLTGRAPRIFEPARPADTGAWNLATGYGVGGGWGSLSLPFQCFVTAYRPLAQGIGGAAGYGVAAGGYGHGALEYANPAMVQAPVADADIDAAIAGVMPVAAIAWTQIAT